MEHLKEIIPMVGPRLIFTKKYNNYLKAQKQLKDPNLDSNFIQPTPPPTPAKQPTPLMQISQPRTEFIEFPAVASSSSALSVVPIEDPPRKKRRFDECLDDLKSILLQSAFGQAILDQKVLTESHRKELVHIIGEHILNNSFR